jgi:NDP-sugar pyrophosphorylase family protein
VLYIEVHKGVRSLAMKCIIPIAGLASRMGYIPKTLLNINGKPLLHRIVEFWKDDVDSFIFVARKEAMSYLWEILPENAIVVFQERPQGLAHAILQVEKCVHDEEFIVALGDCLYNGVFEKRTGKLMGIGTLRTTEEELRKNFLVEHKEGIIKRLTEKPSGYTSSEQLCGMGVYFLHPPVFDYIRKANIKPGGGDFTYILQSMSRDYKIVAVPFEGEYINVTYPEDIKKADAVASRKNTK